MNRSCRTNAFVTYRDELEAALHRARQGEQALAEERARSAQKDQQIQWLQQQLGSARSQLAVLGSVAPLGVASHAEPSRALRISQRVLWAIALLAVVLTGLAGSQRERDGIFMAQLAAPVWGAALAGQLTARRGIVPFLASLVLGALAGFVLMALFFGLLWPAL